MKTAERDISRIDIYVIFIVYACTCINTYINTSWILHLESLYAYNIRTDYLVIMVVWIKVAHIVPIFECLVCSWWKCLSVLKVLPYRKKYVSTVGLEVSKTCSICSYLSLSLVHACGSYGSPQLLLPCHACLSAACCQTLWQHSLGLCFFLEMWASN